MCFWHGYVSNFEEFGLFVLKVKIVHVRCRLETKVLRCSCSRKLQGRESDMHRKTPFKRSVVREFSQGKKIFQNGVKESGEGGISC